MPSVKSARSRIDRIDVQILKLLGARLGLAREVGRAKGKGAPILVPSREEVIFRRIKRISDAERLPWPLVQAVYRDVISLCRASQGRVSAHVLGPAGTHSEWAARACFGEALDLKYSNSIPAAIRAAERAVALGDVNAVAVVPLENSLEGAVTAAVDSLLGTKLLLVSEGYYRVHHALLSKASRLSDVKTVYSHPMGLAQCKGWLQEKLPHAKRIEVASTAEAARLTSKNAAAIASPRLAGAGAKILVGDVQDSSDNTTRFGVLGARESTPTGDDKTSMVFSLPNKSGSLSDALAVFSRHKVNMTKIESRPHRGLSWEYLFFVDLDGHVVDSKVARALESFESKVRNFKILGAYPKGRAWN